MCAGCECAHVVVFWSTVPLCVFPVKPFASPFTGLLLLACFVTSRSCVRLLQTMVSQESEKPFKGEPRVVQIMNPEANKQYVSDCSTRYNNSHHNK